ncbi:MAG: putative DNA-binding domain-containing protein [Rickettsiales bacterium]|nr:putative DNA-binding domain-containing protein [Rickettsiales bacterium]
MKDLKTLQHNFIEYLYSDEKNLLLHEIKIGKTSKHQLLNIYKQNLVHNLTNSLANTYPRIKKLISDEKFHKISQEFIKTSRSFDTNLDNYGKNFANFLLLKKEFFLHDLAICESMINKSYHAYNTSNLDISKIANLTHDDAGKIKFKLIDSCYIFSSRFNLHRKTIATKQLAKPLFYKIIKIDNKVSFNKINKSEFEFINAINQQSSLAEMHNKNLKKIGFYLENFIQNMIISEII